MGNVNYRELHIDSDMDWVVIPPTGMLIGVVLSLPLDGAGIADYGWEITDNNGAALYAEDFYYVGLHDTGHHFTEPMPNTNTATPYVLKLSKPHPKIILRLFSEWP